MGFTAREYQSSTGRHRGRIIAQGICKALEVDLRDIDL
jgi:hypothetical protein